MSISNICPASQFFSLILQITLYLLTFLVPLEMSFPLLLYHTNLCHYSKPRCFFNRICKAQKLYAENGVMYLYTQKYIWKIYWTDFTKIKHFQLFTFTLNYIFPIILSSFYVLTIFFDLILKFLMVTNSFLINLHYECILLLEGNFFYRFSIFQKIL